VTIHPLARQDGPDVLLTVHVQPRASRIQVRYAPDRVSVRLTAPPVDGAANAACCACLAELLNFPKSRLSVIRGLTSRKKLIRIAGSDARQIIARLQSATTL
jgi:uncharacterized protein (TIGR00251 family)